jgi:hypothetical protein
MWQLRESEREGDEEGEWKEAHFEALQPVSCVGYRRLNTVEEQKAVMRAGSKSNLQMKASVRSRGGENK